MIKAVSIILGIIFGTILCLSLIPFGVLHSGSTVLEKETFKQGFIDFFEQQLIQEHGSQGFQEGETNISNQCKNESNITLDLANENVTVSCDDIKSTNVTYAIGSAFFETMYSTNTKCDQEIWKCIQDSEGKYVISPYFKDDVQKISIYLLIAVIVSFIVLFLAKISLKSFFLEIGLSLMISAFVSWIPFHLAIQNLGFNLEILNKFYSHLLVFVVIIAVIGAILFILSFFIKEKKFKKRKTKFS